MKVGLIARCEDRGLGVMTRAFYEHMQPERVLIVVPPNNDLPKHYEWYEDKRPYAATAFLREDGTLNEGGMRDWIDGLDVIYTAETFYDWRIVEWAREAGVATVCHVMPEYFRPDWRDMPVTEWWTPTVYRLDHLPNRTRIVPVPIELGEAFAPNFEPHERLHWMHPAGARAKKDRNGTTQVIRAVQHCTEEHLLTICTQDPIDHFVHTQKVAVEIQAERTNRWRNYKDIDAVILPRKYGGLSLPALEAMASGCALVMPNVPPQWQEWPIVPLDCNMTEGGTIQLYHQAIPLAVVEPTEIARVMDMLARDPALLLAHRMRSLAHAERHSWQSLKGMYVRALERAAG